MCAPDETSRQELLGHLKEQSGYFTNPMEQVGEPCHLTATLLLLLEVSTERAFFVHLLRKICGSPHCYLLKATKITP